MHLDLACQLTPSARSSAACTSQRTAPRPHAHSAARRALRQDREGRMVGADGLALEAARLRGALVERAGAVLSLEQRRARLAAALQRRLRDIQARAARRAAATPGCAGAASGCRHAWPRGAAPLGTLQARFWSRAGCGCGARAAVEGAQHAGPCDVAAGSCLH